MSDPKVQINAFLKELQKTLVEMSKCINDVIPMLESIHADMNASIASPSNVDAPRDDVDQTSDHRVEDTYANFEDFCQKTSEDAAKFAGV